MPSTPGEGPPPAPARPWVLALLLLGLWLPRLPLLAEPLGRDQAVYLMFARRWLLEGATPYREVWDHKPPGLYLLYGLPAAAAPDGAGLLVLETALASLALVLAFPALRRSLGEGAALGAAAVYLACFDAPFLGGFWSRAQAEALVDPLWVAALLAASSSRSQGGKALRGAFGAGLALGAMGLVKLSLAPLALPVLLVLLAPGEGEAPPRPGAFLAGLLVLPAALAAWLAARGAGPAAWDALVIFNLGHVGAGPPADLATLAEAALRYADTLGPPLLLALAGTRARPLVDPTAPRRAGALTLAGLAGAGLSIAIQGKYWCYHFLPLVPPLAAGAALALHQARRRGATGSQLGLCCLLCLVPAARDWWAYLDEHRLLGAATREERLATYSWRDGDFSALRLAAAARQVEALVPPGGTVFAWAFEPGLYLLSRRAPAARFLFHYPLYGSRGGLRTRLQAALLADLAAHPPDLVVVGTGPPDALETRSAAEPIGEDPGLARLLATSYRITARGAGFDFLVPRR